MADKAVSFTMKDPTNSEITQVSITRQGAGVRVTAFYSLVDANGAVVHGGQVEVPLSGTPLSNLTTWLSANILPAIRTQEAM